ncbi:MAG: iron ABC transporter permease [Bacteroidota bacterium]
MSKTDSNTWPGLGPKWGLILALFVLLFVFFILDLLLGSVQISIGDVWASLWGSDSAPRVERNIIQKIRLPKALTAILVGAGLSVGGLQMQTLFRNPLAGPSVLGISSGASLGVALLMFVLGGSGAIWGFANLEISGSSLLVLAASLGAALIFFLILLLSYRIRDNVVLLILGIMMGFITSSLVSIWQYFSDPGLIQDYLIWTFGSLGGVSREKLLILSICVGIGVFIAFLLSKALNMLLLGENYARGLGLHIQQTRIWIILSTSLLTGSIVGFCGPIGFIGIAVPHLTRSLFNTSDHRILIPTSCLIGAIIMLGCDLIAQLPGYSIALPINAVTALIGAPVVIVVILKRRNLQRSF